MSWRLIEEMSEITGDDIQKSKNNDFKKIQTLYLKYLNAKRLWEDYLTSANVTLDNAWRHYKLYQDLKKEFETETTKIFKFWSCDR